MEKSINQSLDLKVLQELELPELFKQVDKFGAKRYHRLTSKDFDNYKCYDRWRYIQGDAELGTTIESKEWVQQNSERRCPVCNDYYYYKPNNGKTIDHKMPRAQYPWLSVDFRNFWVICWECNRQKAEMNWYEYERYIFKNYPDRYHIVQEERPTELLQSLANQEN